MLILQSFWVQKEPEIPWSGVSHSLSSIIATVSVSFSPSQRLNLPGCENLSHQKWKVILETFFAFRFSECEFWIKTPVIWIYSMWHNTTKLTIEGDYDVMFWVKCNLPRPEAASDSLTVLLKCSENVRVGIFIDFSLPKPHACQSKISLVQTSSQSGRQYAAVARQRLSCLQGQSSRWGCQWLVKESQVVICQQGCIFPKDGLCEVPPSPGVHYAVQKALQGNCGSLESIKTASSCCSDGKYFSSFSALTWMK